MSLVSNRPERLRPGSRLAASLPAAPGALAELEVEQARAHQARFIVTFAGFSDRDAAERLRNATLLAAPIAPGGDDWFVHELIGCELVERSGRVLGTVTAVEANPASDLLVVDGRHLVPLRFVVERRSGCLVAELPEGLVE